LQALLTAEQVATMTGYLQISMTLRYVHPTPEHKQDAVKKLEQFNVDQVFALYERLQTSGSPQKSPQ
jgi:hypothetical protein